MLRNIVKCTFNSKPVRPFSLHGAPIKMSYDIYESKRTDNKKPPLIIMHGLFGSKKNWRSVSQAVEPKTSRRIITVDARNHGESPHTNEHGSEYMALDIIELMKQRGIKKSSVMGHSMGGRTMMFLALQYPNYVQDGIIIDISPIAVPRDFAHMEKIFLAMKSINIPGNLSLGDGRKFAEMTIKDAVGQQETVDFILMNLRKINGEFSWNVNIDSLYNNLRQFSNFMNTVKGVEPYRGRMMFICGNQSNFVDPKTWPEIQKLFPNSEIHWLNAGHLVHYDQPDKFIELLVQFLNK